MAEAMRQIILYPDREDGGWVVEVPSLPGCISQGETVDEAIRNIREAMAGWLEIGRERGWDIPEERFEARVVVVAEPVPTETVSA